ncbi:MAG: hypothetical protein Q9214_002420 [Letrouitia sp. 1 TL-2023]
MASANTRPHLQDVEPTVNPSPPGSLRDPHKFRGEKGSKKQSGMAGDIEGRTPGETGETGEQWRVPGQRGQRRSKTETT